MAVTSLASAQVRPPNYSPDVIPETSFTCDFILTCEALIRYRIGFLVWWPYRGRVLGSYCQDDNYCKKETCLEFGAKIIGLQLMFFFLFFPGILLVAVTSLASAQVRPPNYSPDAIPETSFTCEDKITGGYYADQEADCQLFHVCVQVSEYEVGPIFLTKVIGS